ncbi:hypothetical protein HMPREF9554_03044 [Treponema phagedenis F0421]|nr:hypothetical protein HMPREF9554_03044 [Treponema phagedenis F0421]
MFKNYRTLLRVFKLAGEVKIQGRVEFIRLCVALMALPVLIDIHENGYAQIEHILCLIRQRG